MQLESSNSRIKLIVGGIIIALAFLIILPGLIAYISGIGRLILLIVVALGLAYGINILMARKAIQRRREQLKQKEAASDTGGATSDSTTS